MKRSQLVTLFGSRGSGRSTILLRLARKYQAKIIQPSDVYIEARNWHPLQLEEAFGSVLTNALETNEVIIVDGFDEITDALGDCFYSARPSILRFCLASTLRQLSTNPDKKLILGAEHRGIQEPFYTHSRFVEIPDLTPEDFAWFFKVLGGTSYEGLDFDRIHKFLPKLNANQIKYVCHLLEGKVVPETEAFLDFLEKHALVSNVNADEVESVSFDSLYGVDGVIEQLYIDIVNPIERPDLVEKVGIKAKRGVLLYGPPGTGKTTVGRALAHKLRSKFFLLDGTVISGTQDFYFKISKIFTAAKENAPSIIFIDDCDVLFEDSVETGLYRYLLTMLDGLESKSNARVTVVLTAMNIGSLPPALIRSGRVELWLKMELPDLRARIAILESQITGTALDLPAHEIQRLAEKCEELTGSDLRRLVGDATNLYGYDLANEVAARDPVQYFNEAIAQLRDHKEQLDNAPAFTAAHHPGKAS